MVSCVLGMQVSMKLPLLEFFEANVVFDVTEPIVEGELLLCWGVVR